jgi:hypothetical protein
MTTNLIDKLKHLPDDRIGDGIYVAYEMCEKRLIRLYLGSKTNGPMMQYVPYDNDAYGQGSEISVMGKSIHVGPDTLYNGYDNVIFLGGAWTNCYSRGDFGKKYAYGGHWSGHTKSLHKRLLISPIKDEHSELLVVPDLGLIELPNGIKGDIGLTDMDCSGHWSIWYATARGALDERLTRDEIPQSALPDISKQHLLENETGLVLDALSDVIEAYNL